MTDQQINEQIEAIKRATIKACETPETARQFLIDAGIIEGIKWKVGQPTTKGIVTAVKEDRYVEIYYNWYDTSKIYIEKLPPPPIK